MWLRRWFEVEHSQLLGRRWRAESGWLKDIGHINGETMNNLLYAYITTKLHLNLLNLNNTLK